jgi:prepilin-type N-terminal cleavage/methylation domain-containing protein
MKKNLEKGFTLIELLVVIAIIGILASVVLASLNSARNKGADAATKANLANARAQAELHYDNLGSSYNNVCGNGINASIAAAAKSSGGTAFCGNSATAWSASAPMKDAAAAGGNYWCVDNTGTARATNTTPTNNTTVCP